MGPHNQHETHEKQSSRMSLAEGWKHEKVRLYSLIFGISFALLFMFTVLLYGTSLKSVTIVVDGKPTVVETRQPTLQRLLDEQAISLGKHDRISASVDAPVKHGDKFEIERSAQLLVTVKGKTRTLHTTNKTVSAALKAASIAYDSDDKLVPAGTTRVKTGMKVKLIQVTTMVVEQKKTIPFETVERKDRSLHVGKKKTVTKGQNGEIVKKVKKTFEDGVLKQKLVVDEQVLSAPKKQIVAIGTRKPVRVLSAVYENDDNADNGDESSDSTITRGGVEFSAKKVLRNVTLTAYTADFSSTGKSKSHKYYGITASGARVKEGQTIAVDTRVIPMGYWVYIEGVGFRRAEDRGSAIKGNKIDVYVETNREARYFGRKRGHTVYVIGPNRPSDN
jgi:uncharacterized protein YabE (DUF348 family)